MALATAEHLADHHSICKQIFLCHRGVPEYPAFPYLGALRYAACNQGGSGIKSTSAVFVGAPNAGKSTLLSIAQEILLGSENVSNIPWQSLSDRFKTAELFGKLANIFADLPSKSIDDNGMFKALTGEDYITAERKNKDPFSLRPYAGLLFSCNEIPRNYSDRSDGDIVS